VTNNLRPIFSDIHKKTFNIDPDSIVNRITPNTSAIVPVHVFGNACEVEIIDKIAKENDLKVVYDAAHAFDVKYKGGSVLNYGDISTLSFHATKLFHTIEGGALIINDDKLAEKARFLINFGIQDSENIPHLGTNAKMNEFEAAMGLCVLDDIDLIKDKRAQLVNTYQQELNGVVQLQEQNAVATQNHSYFPILTKSEDELLLLINNLNKNGVNPRRYFYPSLDTLSYIEPKQNMPVSRDIASRIACLPLYPDLNKNDQLKIINIIKNSIIF